MRHVGRLIADALRCEPTDAAPLSDLVHAKTAGNPFFVLQFLHALADEGLLAFDHEARGWSWDLDRIHAKGYADNVVDLMVGKLARLPDTTAGSRCSSWPVSATSPTSRRSRSYSGRRRMRSTRLCGTRSELELVERLPGAYKFVHDRVQEAAYSLIPEEQRAAAHLRIGRLLVAQTPAREVGKRRIFEIVNQLNRGAELIASQDEREHLAEINLIAGKRAKASTAYASALKYLAAGAALLAEDCWKRRHALTFALELQRAECEFLTGALTEADARLAELSHRGVDTVEQATVTCLRIESVHDARSERTGHCGRSRLPKAASRHRLVAASDRRGGATRIRADLAAAWESHDRGAH